MPVKVIDMCLPPNLYFMVRGPSKSGKTHLLGQILGIEELCPVLWLSLDDSHATLTTRAYQQKYGIDLDWGLFLSVSSYKDFLSTLNSVLQGKLPLIDDRPYRSIVCDNWTQFIEYLVIDNLAEAPNDNKERARAIEGTAGRGDYRVVRTQIVTLLDKLRYELNVNIFSSADERRDVMEGGASRIEIGVPPGLIGPVNRAHDVCGAMFTHGDRYAIRFRPEGVVHGVGDRYQALPPVIEQPTMQQIYQLINQSRS
jgi:hypothetical protein